MKVALASDIHLEFGPISLTNDEQADVLILSGDICMATHFSYPNSHVADYYDFFKQVCSEFPHVVYITGNHESYHYDIARTTEKLREALAEHKNLHILDDSTVDIMGYTFVGGTLWTDMNEEDSDTLKVIEHYMNDFRCITDSDKGRENFGTKKFLPIDSVKRHRRTVDYISHVINNNPEGQYIVVGHHGPSRLSVHNQFKHERIGNGAFVSSLDEFIHYRPQIKLWTHGHTHYPFDYMIGKTRIVCNPRGYIGYEPWAADFKLQYIEV